MADYYELLGVAERPSADELKKAYRQRARELHPDANPDDPQAAERFKEVSRAYAVLSDDEQRARYDRFGEAGVGGQSGVPNMDDLFGNGGGLGDIFEAFFGGPARSAVADGGPSWPATWPGHGSRRLDHLRTGGVRRPDPRRRATAAALRSMQRFRCRRGHAAGHVCRVQRVRSGPACSPERARTDGVEQSVPTLRRFGSGRHHAVHEVPRRRPDHARQDLHRRRARWRRRRLDPPPHASRCRWSTRRCSPAISTSTCESQPHDRYRRIDDDLVTDVHISIVQAALGTKIQLPTLDGDEELVVHAGTQPGHEFVLRGRGVPRLHGRGPRRPARDRAGRGALQALQRRIRSAPPVRRGSAASRSPSRAACSRRSSRHSRDRTGGTRDIACRCRPRRGRRCRAARARRRHRTPPVPGAAGARRRRRHRHRRPRRLASVPGGRRRCRARRPTSARPPRRSSAMHRGVRDPEGRSTGMDRPEAHRDRCRPHRVAARRTLGRALGCGSSATGTSRSSAGWPSRRSSSRARSGCPRSTGRSRPPTCCRGSPSPNPADVP